MRLDARAWAFEEFGSAKVKDERRRRRLLDIATEVARSPSGVVAVAIRGEAARQGAYDFLEGEAVRSASLEDAVARACATRAAAEKFALVPIDGTTLSFSDPSEKKEIGVLGRNADGAAGRGLKVVSALALDPCATSAGTDPLTTVKLTPSRSFA